MRKKKSRAKSSTKKQNKNKMTDKSNDTLTTEKEYIQIFDSEIEPKIIQKILHLLTKHIKNITNPYNCLLRNDHFLVNTTND